MTLAFGCGLTDKDQKPLTLALSRRERGLTEVVGLDA